MAVQSSAPTSSFRLSTVLLLTALMFIAGRTFGQSAWQQKPPSDASASSSLLAGAATAPPSTAAKDEHSMRVVSMFAVTAPKPRTFNKHDLIEIVVRETSRVEARHRLDAEKEYKLTGGISAWPHIRLADLLELQLRAGRTTDLPQVGVAFDKGFEGEGRYRREDDLTARLTAEVIEVLPNGHLVLEARTHIKTDEEEATLRVTGICRPEDVSPANTILSSQIHDLEVEKIHKGELKKANEKGVIAKVLDFIFAF